MKIIKVGNYKHYVVECVNLEAWRKDRPKLLKIKVPSKIKKLLSEQISKHRKIKTLH